MTEKTLKDFLDALHDLRNDFVCAVCSELCKNPVTLSVCFHAICAEHYNSGLKFCPECNADVENCKTLREPELERSIEITKQLEEIFSDQIRSSKTIGTEDATTNKKSETTERRGAKTRKLNSTKADTSPKNKLQERNIEKTVKTKTDKATKVSKNESNKTLSRANSKENLMSVPKNEGNKTLSRANSKENLKSVSKNESTKTLSRANSKENLKSVPKNESNKTSRANSKENLKSVPKNESTKTLSRANSKENLKSFNESTSSAAKLNKALEKRNTKGETMLHIACRLGKVNRVLELLNEGANANTKDNAGWTPLHEVVQNGRLDLVKLLLQHNALINVPGQSNETPLHEAIRYGHCDIIEELVRNGADVNLPNIKGETPSQLASGDIKKVLEKAQDDIIQTQTFNISIISDMQEKFDFEDMHIYCMSQVKSVNDKLKTLLKHHKEIHLETKHTKKVTHLIVDTEDGLCLSSVDVLQAIVYSQWVISSNWIIESTKNHLEPFNRHEVIGVGVKTYKGPKNSRYNKYKQLPGIFNGCHFYLHNFNTKYEVSKTMVLTKATLSKLITDAGGIILNRVPNPESIPEKERSVPYHANKDGKLTKCAHYIIFKDIYEPMYNMQHLKALPVGWLIECIEKYELCEPW